jgi:putative proteasome-type protease
MTYGIPAYINEGLILVSDSRTKAGIDNISDHSKMHVLITADDRNIVLLCEGNLSTTQAVLEQWHRDKVKNA